MSNARTTSVSTQTDAPRIQESTTLILSTLAGKPLNSKTIIDESRIAEKRHKIIYEEDNAFKELEKAMDALIAHVAERENLPVLDVSVVQSKEKLNALIARVNPFKEKYNKAVGQFESVWEQRDKLQAEKKQPTQIKTLEASLLEQGKTLDTLWLEAEKLRGDVMSISKAIGFEHTQTQAPTIPTPRAGG